MSSKKKNASRAAEQAPLSSPAPQAVSVPAPESALPFPRKWLWLPPVLMVLFFLATCLSTASTIKPLVMALGVIAVGSCLFRFSYVRDRFSLPLIGVSAWMVANGVSTLYAASGSFALAEFLKLLLGFCVLLLILAWAPRGERGARVAASVLAGGTALASLFSIDTLSTHFLSNALFRFLFRFSFDYFPIRANSVEVGVRMISIYENPNVFAGIAGLGVLLCLSLAVTAGGKGERCFHIVCLFLNALAFLLVFSMGASGMIALAFLVLLLLERKDRKGSMLILMVETFALALGCAFPIFLTSFGEWESVQPVPLACAVGGAALLFLLDSALRPKVAGALGKGGGKVFLLLLVAVLALLVIFAAAAVNLTGPAELAAGERLRRAEYPAGGEYTLEVQTSGPLTVTIESQNQQETMMHTSTVLYSGDAAGAQFTVPEDSLVTYFNFRAGEALTLSDASFTGAGGATSLKLHYRLLPGFIANRLQGLFANENAIQRVVFFADGFKLFQRSPVWGLGLGAFESAAPGVQSFYYETRYTHNHYVETLLTTGVIGLVLFVGMLGLCGVAIWKNYRRKEEADPLTPALGAALVFMAGHGAVEVVFSSRYYLPMALGVLGLICLCCGKELPFLPEKEEVRSWGVVALCGLTAAYLVLLGLNMKAGSRVAKEHTYSSLTYAASVDRFDRNTYMLSYVVSVGEQGVDKEQDWDLYKTASEYAARLARVDSNTIPPYLARFYFSVDQPEDAVAMLKKHVNFLSANSGAWQTVFDILSEYSDRFPQCDEAAKEIYGMFREWNGEHMGTITLTGENQEYIDRVMGG